jgi:hypothetical protein
MRWLALLAVACGSSPAPTADAPPPATAVLMDFTRTGFFDAPFPSDDLVSGGHVRLDGFPNPDGRPLVSKAFDMLASAHGFALTGGVWFRLTGAPGPLPDAATSVTADASVFVMNLDDGTRAPLEVSFSADGGRYGAPNLLALVPVQGFPRRPRTRYAAVIRRALGDAGGQPLAALATAGLPAGYADAISVLAQHGVPAADLAGLAVFTTDDPTAEIATFRADVLGRPRPAPGSFTAKEVFDDYCVFATTIDMPDYQTGTSPFTNAGGAWTVDANGRPVLDHTETANLVVTVPRRSMPKGGYPLVEFVRTGGGGDRPLVDRGTADANGVSLAPGTGPALYFARAGYAGISVDGPVGGLRNPGHGDEQFLVFNIFNGVALRDNVRESALELSLLANIVDTISFDSSSCPGAAATTRFDIGHLVLMGHSTGAWIAQLALAIEPRFQAGILSGAGSSWIDNIIYKQRPIPPAQYLAALLNEDLPLVAGDPVISLIEWAAESADGQVYNRRTVREPAAGETARHVLMEQGIVDHYILPRIANATSVSMGLDLAGTPLDAGAGLTDEPTLESLLPLANRAPIMLPAQGNVGGTITAIVVQHPADGIEDGHEVVFQTEAPKQEYRCFLESLLTGVPRVPVGTRADAPCPTN